MRWLALVLLLAGCSSEIVGITPPAECDPRNAIWQPLKIPTEAGEILVYVLRC